MNLTSRGAKLATIALALPLALAACGGGAEGGGESSAQDKKPDAEATAEATNAETFEPVNPTFTYEFTQEVFVAEGDLVVRFPEQLKSEVDNQVEEMAFSYRELDSLEYCAADVTITYADGALEQLQDPSEDLEPILKSDKRQTREGVEERLGEPGDDAVAKSMFSSSAVHTADELDLDDPHEGVFVEEGAQKATIVLDCATEPGSITDSQSDTIDFPSDNGRISRYSAAYFSLSITKSGTLSVLDGNVGDYEVDHGGSWTKK